jgi:hypothetical protein
VALDQQLRITPPGHPLEEGVNAALREGLETCPDLAFAHLVDVEVPNQGEGPAMVLFVWLDPVAMRSIRAALNLVSEIVARALPGDRFVDVVILNSAPELLPDVESAGCLFIEPHPDERRRALAVMRVPGP